MGSFLRSRIKSPALVGDDGTPSIAAPIPRPLQDPAGLPELTSAQFDVLRHAVNKARTGPSWRLESLSNALLAEGHAQEDVAAALEFWCASHRRRPPPLP